MPPAALTPHALEPVIDRSGGARRLRAASLTEAEALAPGDPLRTTGSSRITVREWQAG